MIPSLTDDCVNCLFQSKLTSKNLSSEKDGVDKTTASSNHTSSWGSSYHDMPYDSDRKEKFKMVLGKSKKDGQDHLSKSTQQQIGVSLDAAAAILQAVTRGIKNPKIDILSNDINHGLSSEGGPASSFQSLISSQPHSCSQKLDPNEGPSVSVSVPVAKAIANTAALAAASEADSSEAHLTKEQKLKAERLKRAKMFAAIIKSGSAPLKTESVCSLSVEPPESGFSSLGRFGGETSNIVVKEREGSSVPVDENTFNQTEKLDRRHSDSEHNSDRRSRRKYRSRSKKYEEKEDDDDDDDDHDDKDDKEEDEKEEQRDHKRSRKKHRSHYRSSHHSRDKHKHRKRHSSSKDQESRHRHKRKHEHDHSNDEHRRHKKWSKKSHSEREVDLEEGEISTKSSDQSKAVSVGGESGVRSREASVGVSNTNTRQDGRSPSQPLQITEVSDDLRAKIRAMLLATL